MPRLVAFCILSQCWLFLLALSQAAPVYEPTGICSSEKIRCSPSLKKESTKSDFIISGRGEHDVKRLLLAQSYDSEIFDSALIREGQLWLYNMGAQITKVDGVLGPETATALRQFQRMAGVPATGTLTQNTLEALRKVQLPKVWGAVAYTGNGGYSSSWNYKTRGEAESSAVKRLRRRTYMQIKVQSTWGTSCIALAQHRRGVATSGGTSIDDAEDAAMAHCRRSYGRRCLIIYTVCADGRHQ